MLILIENGEVYAPEYQGRKNVLIANNRVEKIGDVSRRGRTKRKPISHIPDFFLGRFLTTFDTGLAKSLCENTENIRLATCFFIVCQGAAWCTDTVDYWPGM